MPVKIKELIIEAKISSADDPSIDQTAHAWSKEEIVAAVLDELLSKPSAYQDHLVEQLMQRCMEQVKEHQKRHQHR